jgi:4-hydroxy-tetrahydrodipicolinate reductase
MSDVIRLAVLGADGRMGRAVVALALDDPRFRLASAQSRAGSSYIGADAAVLSGRPSCGVTVSDDLAGAIRAADVVIDFTRPDFSADVATECARARRALVSGTTGMNTSQRARFQSAAEQVPVLWAPNMSIGVNLLLAALEQVASRIGDDYDAEIVEAHHRHKVDAPSGTALALGEVLAAVRGEPLAALAEHGHAASGPRQRGRIGFHSIRAGEIVGEHDVRLVSAGEEIRLGHRAFSRDAFASGALRAAAWLHGRKAGFYGIRDLLDLPKAGR